MFWVGTSFIFCSINARSSSVTLNLICTVLFLPLMPRSFLPAKRVWDTSQQAIFSRRAAGRRGRKYGKGTPFLCLLRKFFLTPYYNEKPRFAKLTQKKNAAISKRLQRFLKPIQFSFSTSAISFAVAVTIRIPLSLMLSSSVSSCRLCVDFSVVLSGKKNWSTDMS